MECLISKRGGGRYHITRAKIFSGIGFVDMKLTAFRLLYCDRVGGAYFSGYETQSCWKPIPNVTVRAPSYERDERGIPDERDEREIPDERERRHSVSSKEVA